MQSTCAILSAEACPALQYFSTFSHKRQDYKKTLFNTKRVFSFPLQLLSETFLILERNKRDMTKNVDKKNQLDVTFVFFISLLLVAQHVSGNHVPIIRS